MAVAAVVLVAAFAAGYRVLVAVETPRDIYSRVLLSPDELFPEALYLDAVHGTADVRAFKFSAATFAVPDLALYGGLRPLLGDPLRAVLPWAAAFYLIVVGSAVVMLRVAVPPDRRAAATANGLLFAAAYLGLSAVTGFEYRQFAEFFLPLYHGGAAAATFLALALAAGMARTPAGWRSWRLPAMVLLTAVGTFSDRLFAVWFAGPFVAAAGACWAFGWHERRAWRGVLATVTATGIGIAAGVLGLKAFQGPGDPLGSYWAGAEVEALSGRAVILLDVTGQEIATGNPVLLAWLGWLGLCGVTLVRAARRRAPADGFAFLAAFSLASSGLTVGVMTLSRATDNLSGLPWEEYSRYLLGPQATAWFGWAAWFARRPGVDPRRWVRATAVWGPLVLGIVPSAVAVARAGPPVRTLTQYYPHDVRVLDAACRDRGLTCGLADYGLAKRATLLSRAGVVVRQVVPGRGEDQAFAGFHWLSNAQWYWNPPPGTSGPVRYQFAVVWDEPWHPWQLHADRVAAVYGEPAARVPLDGPVLFVYDRPQDAAFQEFADRDPGLLGLREAFGPPAR